MGRICIEQKAHVFTSARPIDIVVEMNIIDVELPMLSVGETLVE
jgi:hypothetical protein